MQKRSIPASAGEPPSGSLSRLKSWVYPRECGGTEHSRVAAETVHGLSPRVRGNPHASGAEAPYLRSIPASAGEPSRRGSDMGRMRVYPRECGGTISFMFSALIPTGLSPRVRGNLFHRRYNQHGEGSIPASAGEPGPRSSLPLTCWVYPRECGGTAAAVQRAGHIQGLSPRVRGNPPPMTGGSRATRSIPASAGEPGLSRTGHRFQGVYPRECGGTQASVVTLELQVGLSPRVRGNPLRLVVRASVPGSIPASAGEPRAA